MLEMNLLQRDMWFFVSAFPGVFCIYDCFGERALYQILKSSISCAVGRDGCAPSRVTVMAAARVARSTA